MNDLLHSSIVGRLVGVIDLKKQRAVHAVAGQRHQYRSVAFCSGDPIALARYYQTLGLPALYVADLDALGNQPVQIQAIESLCDLNPDSHVLVDAGLGRTGATRQLHPVARLAAAKPNTRWIVASESGQVTASLDKVSQAIDPSQLLVGLDFRGNQFLATDEDPVDWIDAADRLEYDGAVVLDLERVGTAGGIVTAELCQRVKSMAPHLTVYSGGGIRSAADIEALSTSGCDRFLTATALFPDDRTGFDLEIRC